MKAEIGVMQLQVKECLQPPEAARGEKQILPHSFQRGYGPADNLISDSWPPKLGQ